MNPITTLSGVGPNPPVVVEAGSAGLRYPLSYYLGDYTSAAISGGATLTVSRNRAGSFSADMRWPNGNEIAGTMPTPSEALAQLESAICREIEG
jgi:hypothetical protein